jgi:hypothetical protein
MRALAWCMVVAFVVDSKPVQGRDCEESSMDYRKQFATNLRAAREARGLSQEQLGKMGPPAPLTD